MYLEAFTREQKRLALDVYDVVEGVELAAKARAEYAGGVHWKTVKGTEYLNRYWTEPDGRKTARSLGPRSRETESQHTAFFANRDRTKTELQQEMDNLEHVGRMGKALRMGRLQADAVEVLQALRETGLTAFEGPLAVAGAAGLACYEIAHEHFAPPVLHREERAIRLLSYRGDPFEEVVDRVVDVLSKKGASGAEYSDFSGMSVIVRDGEPPVEVWNMKNLIERIAKAGGRRAADHLVFYLQRDVERGIAFGRNSSVVAMEVLSPAAYGIVSPFMTAQDEADLELAIERSRAAEELAEAAGRPLSPRERELTEMARQLVAEQGFGEPRPRI